MCKACNGMCTPTLDRTDVAHAGTLNARTLTKTSGFGLAAGEFMVAEV